MKRTDVYLKVVFILFLITLIGHGVVIAQQFPSDFWHKGKVVLVEGDTLAGNVKYDFINEVVQLEKNDKILTFNSKSVLYFEIFDITVDAYRQFYSLPFEVSPNYKTPILFEVLFEGELSLLAREMYTTKTSSYTPYYYPGSTYTRTVLDYDFYFVGARGEISYFTGKKRQLLEIMSRHSAQINNYIKDHNLKIDRRSDLARVTAFYNGLK